MGFLYEFQWLKLVYKTQQRQELKLTYALALVQKLLVFYQPYWMKPSVKTTLQIGQSRVKS
jgi:hypothetical protein